MHRGAAGEAAGAEPGSKKQRAAREEKRDSIGADETQTNSKEERERHS